MNLTPRTSRLLAFARELHRAETLADLLLLVRAEIEETLGYSHAWLYVAEADDPDEWRIVDVAGAKHGIAWSDFPVLRVRGDAMLEEIAGSNEPVVVADARTDPRTNKAIVEHLGNRTIVNVPLRLLDAPLGAFGTGTFGDAEGCRVPTADQLDYLVGIGSQLSVAAGRIRMLEERRRAEETLRLREEELAATLHSIGDAVIATDASGRVTRLNPVAERLTGWSFDDAAGRDVRDVFRIVDESTRAPVEIPVERVLREGVVVGLANHTVLVARDGSERPVADSAAPIRDRKGALRGVVLVFRDQSEERKAQRAIELGAARLQVLAESSRQFAIATADFRKLLDVIARRLSEAVGDLCSIRLISKDGQYLEASDALWHPDPETLAIARQVVFPQRLGEGIAGGVAASGVAALVPVVATAEVVAQTAPQFRHLVEWLGVRSLLVVPIQASHAILGVISMTRSDAARPFTEDDLELARDLADRAALAIENAQLLAELEERVAQRTAAIAEAHAELEAFSYSVAHDLRGPLRGMNGFGAALLEDYGDKLDGEGKQYLGRIVASAARMGELIDALLTLARVSRAEPRREPVNLTQIAHAVVAQLRSADPARTVNVVVTEGLTTIGDPRLLRALLENLIGNAWKFTSKRERATIELGREGTDGGATFYVRDDGAGFDMAYADKLFMPFQRLHSPEEFDGTGIGLATVQRIVRRHGGRIWAEGVVDGGATLRFTLGGATANARPSRVVPPPGAPGATG